MSQNQNEVTLDTEDIIDLSAHLYDTLMEQQALVFEQSPLVSTAGWLPVGEKSAVLQMSWSDPDIAKELLLAISSILQEFAEEGYVNTLADVQILFRVVAEIGGE